MPTLETHSSSNLVKMLLMGNSGVGKTGALASLASAGYRLFIADFDNGLDILLDESILPASLRSQVYYKTLQDKPVVSGGAMIQRATAWQEFMKALGDWKEDGKSLGSFRSWGEKDVLVVDSLTFASDRAFDDALQIAGRLGQRPQIQDYGAAIDSVQSMLELLYGSACTCNVVMTAHLQFIGDEMSGTRKAYPNVIGQKLAPKVPRLFNSMVLMEKQIVGNSIRRSIKTVGNAFVDLKVSKPGLIPATIEPDLGKLFRALLGEKVQWAKAAP